MQDYNSWYPSQFRKSAQNSKLTQIRKLLTSGLPPEIMLLMIAAIVLPADIMTALKK